MTTFANRMARRSDLYNRSASARVRKIINRSVVRRMPSRTLTRTATRPTVRMSARPRAVIRTRPGIYTSARLSLLPVGSGVGPGVGPGAGVDRGVGGAGGLPGGGLTGGITNALGGIGGDVSSTFGGIIEQAKALIPTAIKIIAAVIILKILLWLLKGRGK